MSFSSFAPLVFAHTLLDSYSSSRTYATILASTHPSSGVLASACSQSWSFSGSYDFVQSKFWLKKYGSPTAVLKGRLYEANGSGKPSGSVLAESSNSISYRFITTSYQQFTFSFTAYELDENKIYVVMIYVVSGLVDGSKYIMVGGYAGGDDGQGSRFVNGYWVATSTDHDFEAWGEEIVGAWNEVEGWIGHLLTREWNPVEAWIGTLFTRGWSLVETWMGSLLTREWNFVEAWIGTLLTRNWNLIETWIGVLTRESILIDYYDYNYSEANILYGIWEQHPSDVGRSASGHTFSANQSYIVTQASFWIMDGSGNPYGTYVASLYEINGTSGVDGIPLGNRLAISEPVNDTDITETTPTLINFYFNKSQRYTITQGNYCISLECFDNSTNGETVYIYSSGHWSNPSGKDDGNWFGYWEGWYSVQNRDAFFRVYGVPAPPSYIGFIIIAVLFLACLIGALIFLALRDED